MAIDNHRDMRVTFPAEPVHRQKALQRLSHSPEAVLFQRNIKRLLPIDLGGKRSAKSRPYARQPSQFGVPSTDQTQCFAAASRVLTDLSNL